MNDWDPNYQLGDVQLMSLASSLTYEETKAEKMKRILAKEKE